MALRKLSRDKAAMAALLLFLGIVVVSLLAPVYAAYSHYVGYAGAETGDPDPSCPACASPHTDLQVSSDGGKTWSSPRALAPSTARQDDPQIVVDAADGRTVYAAFMQDNKSSQYVARSDDYGSTWRTIDGMEPR